MIGIGTCFDQAVDRLMILAESSGIVPEAECRIMAADFITFAGSIKKSWEEACFSIEKAFLNNYFGYQVDKVRRAGDRIGTLRNTYKGPAFAGLLCSCERELAGLIEHLLHFFYRFIDPDVILPQAFLKAFWQDEAGSKAGLEQFISNATLDVPLKDCILRYLRDIEAEKILSFGSLYYYQQFSKTLGRLNEHTNTEFNGLITDALTRVNFNNLEFFLYRTSLIAGHSNGMDTRASLAYLNSQLEELPPVAPFNCVYDPDWPALSVMLSLWLKEQILKCGSSGHAAISVPMPKVETNLSVAHLACLLKLFVEENVYITDNLSELFKVIAGQFRTKRQATISPGSLSKEFYSVNQITAARVLDLTERMSRRIRRDYFPVTVAISVIALLC